MRRQGGHYGGDSGGGAAGQMHQQRQQQNKSGHYQGRHQEQQILGEKEGHQHQNLWRWERDGAETELPQTTMSPTAPFAEGREAPKFYFQSQRLDPQVPLEKQGGGDPRTHPHEEDMDIGYEDTHVLQTFESLEQRFLDDIMKLCREQTDAEDTENARHRERLNGISAQYQEQLVALRARHASLREEFLLKESQARHQQYQQIVMEQYPSGNMSPSNPSRGYNAGSAPTGEPHPHRAYNSDYHDSRERSRLSGSARDHGFDRKVPYPRGRSYDTGARYY